MSNGTTRFRRIQPLAIALALTTVAAILWPMMLPLLVAASAVFLAGVVLVAADLVLAELRKNTG